MNIDNNCKINDIEKNLMSEFKAKEITKEELLSLDSNMLYIEYDKSRIYKINDSDFIQSLLSKNEKVEIEITINHLKENVKEIDFLSYEYKISTGKLIIIILESKDGENLSSFTMKGNGEVLFNYLSKCIGEDLQKNENPLDEVIEDLNHFKPYGKYFN